MSIIIDIKTKFKVITAPEFDKWLHSLRDSIAQKQIIFRIRRFERANFGDVKPAGGGVYEARIDYCRAIGFITRGAAARLSLCFAAVTKARKSVIL